MNSVFISGSIEITTLSQPVQEALNNIINKNLKVLIGDARGVDEAAQKYLFKHHYTNVEIFSIKNPPRICISKDFTIRIVDYQKKHEYLILDDKEKNKIQFSERKKQTFKDIEMSKIADYFLVVWDNKSKGTKDNILRGIQYNKKIKLIIGDKIIPPENIKADFIHDQYENANGICIKDLRERLDQELGEENIPSKDLLKKSKVLRSLYPSSSKTFLLDSDNYSEYKIITNFKGIESIKFKPNIVKLLKNEILKYKNNVQDKTLFFQFSDKDSR